MPCPQIMINCPKNCPAQDLKKLPGYGRLGAFPQGTNWDNWVNYCENLRRDECNRILQRYGQIKLYILTESIPYSRFIYDRQSNYCANVGLRTRLCRELINANCPPNINHCSQCPNLNKLLNYLRDKGILIVDCALCPLYRLNKFSARRHAATICLNNNTIAYLNVTPNAPIITIFPLNCGFLKTKKPHVQSRVVKEFRFGNLTGLRKAIEQSLGDP